MSPRDFLKMCEGFNLKRRIDDQKYYSNLKMMRWVGALIYNSNVKKGDRKEPQELFPLMGDNQEKEQVEIITKEEMEDMKRWIKN